MRHVIVPVSNHIAAAAAAIAVQRSFYVHQYEVYWHTYCLHLATVLLCKNASCPWNMVNGCHNW